MSTRHNVAVENESTFSSVMRQHSGGLLVIAMKITRNRPVAEDIVQEAFLKLWQQRNEIVPQNLGGWLYKVVAHLAYKHLQKESRQLRVVSLLTHTKTTYGESVDNMLITKENNRILNDIFRRLPEQQLTVYHLSREKGMRRGEIAEHLNLSPNTVKVHLSRALRFIRANIVGLSVFMLLFFLHNFIFRESNTNVVQKDLYHIKQLANRETTAKKVIRISSTEPMLFSGIYR